MAVGRDPHKWTLLTAHGRALVAIAQNPEARMMDLAQVVGVTERTVQVIVADLEAAGYLTRERVGRRNRYTVHLQRPFRHRAQNGLQVGPFLEVLAAAEPLPAWPGANGAPVPQQGAEPAGRQIEAPGGQ